MKRQLIIGLILVLLIGMCFGAYFGVDYYQTQKEEKAAEEAAASGTETPKENTVTKIASGFLGVVLLIALAAGGIFYAFTKQKQKKQAEKEALDPDANYTEDKGDFEIPTEDEPEEPGEEDTEPI